MRMMTRMTTFLSALILGGLLLAVTGCETMPRDESSYGGFYAKQQYGRMALRGAAYKRLLGTYTEVRELEEELTERIANETDPGRIAAGEALLVDAEKFEVRAHKALDLRRRLKWHRVQVGKLWKRYKALYPEDAPLHKIYKKERRVDRDEIRNRRTPLTHEMRWSPRNKPQWDTIPEQQGIWADRPVVEVGLPPHLSGSGSTPAPVYSHPPVYSPPPAYSPPSGVHEPMIDLVDEPMAPATAPSAGQTGGGIIIEPI